MMLAALIGLGTWQLDRLQWKTSLLATIEARIHAEPVDIAQIPADADYVPATASGAFLNTHEMYLFAISKDGIGGYHVLTPLRLEDGRYLLVDRGWIPYDHRPQAGMQADYARPDGDVEVTGILRAPRRVWMQPHNHPASNDWYGIDLAAMARFAGVDAFMPYVLEADDTPNTGGYPIGGQTRITLPNNHLEYAVTWYGLALALLVIYLASGWRKNAAD